MNIPTINIINPIINISNIIHKAICNLLCFFLTDFLDLEFLFIYYYHFFSFLNSLRKFI